MIAGVFNSVQPGAAQWNFFLNKESNSPLWQGTIGSATKNVTIAWPNAETYPTTTEIVAGLRTRVSTTAIPETAEVATQVGTSSGRVRQELDVSEIPFFAWLSLTPSAAINVGGNQPVGGMLSVNLNVRPLATANVGSFLQGLGLWGGAKWATGDMITQGVYGAAPGLSPQGGVLMSSPFP
jgi:hypothetical protein